MLRIDDIHALRRDLVHGFKPYQSNKNLILSTLHVKRSSPLQIFVLLGYSGMNRERTTVKPQCVFY